MDYKNFQFHAYFHRINQKSGLSHSRDFSCLCPIGFSIKTGCERNPIAYIKMRFKDGCPLLVLVLL